MLAMTVHSHLRGRAKPIVFLPTYVGYERLMEGATEVKCSEFGDALIAAM